MKSIVVDIDNKDAVILSDDGLFIRIKNENYGIGQPIKIKENRRMASKLIVGAAGMAAALAVCTIGAFAYYTPTDYVSLDVNPSVEYSVNMFDRILYAKALNDDGAEILSSLDLNNMTIQDAVKETLDKLVTDGYLTDDPDGGVVITTSNDDMDEAEQLAAELKHEIQTYLNSRKVIVAEVDAEAVGLDRVHEARELGVTPGKLNLVKKLQESTSGAISTEEWLARPVREINKAIKENRKHEKDKANQTFKWEDQLEQEETVSDDEIDLDETESMKSEKVRRDGRSNLKDHQNKSKDTELQQENERFKNENNNHGADQIENEEERENNENRLTDEDESDSENQHDDSGSKPNGSRFPNGDDD